MKLATRFGQESSRPPGSKFNVNRLDWAEPFIPVIPDDYPDSFLREKLTQEEILLRCINAWYFRLSAKVVKALTQLVDFNRHIANNAPQNAHVLESCTTLIQKEVAQLYENLKKIADLQNQVEKARKTGRLSQLLHVYDVWEEIIVYRSHRITVRLKQFCVQHHISPPQELS